MALLSKLKEKLEVAKATKEAIKNQNGNLNTMQTTLVSVIVLIIMGVFGAVMIDEFTKDVEAGSFVEGIVTSLTGVYEFFTGKIQLVVLAIVFVIIMGYILHIKKQAE